MAQEAILSEGALEVANAIHGYAESRSWKPQDYHIFTTVDERLPSLRITVVSDKYKGRTEDQEVKDFDGVMDFIEHEVSLREYFNIYSLVLTGTDGYAFYPTGRLGENEYAIDEKLINHGVSWSGPSRAQPAARKSRS
jgi:hypothetical protein